MFKKTFTLFLLFFSSTSVFADSLPDCVKIEAINKRATQLIESASSVHETSSDSTAFKLSKQEKFWLWEGAVRDFKYHRCMAVKAVRERGIGDICEEFNDKVKEYYTKFVEREGVIQKSLSTLNSELPKSCGLKDDSNTWMYSRIWLANQSVLIQSNLNEQDSYCPEKAVVNIFPERVSEIDGAGGPKQKLSRMLVGDDSAAPAGRREDFKKQIDSCFPEKEAEAPEEAAGANATDSAEGQEP